MPVANERGVLRGWKHHPSAARVLLVLMLGGLVASAWLPKEWMMARDGFRLVGVFAAGMVAAQHAAIWQQTDC